MAKKLMLLLQHHSFRVARNDIFVYLCTCFVSCRLSGIVANEVEHCYNEVQPFPGISSLK